MTSTLPDTKRFYIDGRWLEPLSPEQLNLVNPATAAAFTRIAMGNERDVDRAVDAAKTAFKSFSRNPVRERQALLRRIAQIYDSRRDELAQAVSLEMGAPLALARTAQVASGSNHLLKMIEVLDTFQFEQARGSTLVLKEPIGVCALITPWNWPLNQIVCKVAPALAAGCTMVLKPSEIAPLSATLFAEILHEAGVPPGVFNLVHGGALAGQRLAEHPHVDMVSFTGSTRAGTLVAKAAADTIKRVHQELGGKSANIILPDADLATSVRRGADACFRNSGQSCNAPTRMLVPATYLDEAIAEATAAADACRVGPPQEESSVIGPVVSEKQFETIQRYIHIGIQEGARLVAGGPGKPPGLNEGYYVRPTVFSHVRPEMRIAREEIFGPVLCILAYETEQQAIELANDSIYGLAAYVQGKDSSQVGRVARALRAGTIYLNHPSWDPGAPFGGYKQSGNGREYADFGLNEYLEIKGIVGVSA